MKKIIITVVVVLVIAGAGYWAYQNSTRSDLGEKSATPAQYELPALTKDYTNSTYNFSLMMPADFAATDSQDPSASSTTLILQNTTGDGIQIVVSTFDEDTGAGYTLTADRIHQDVPDLTITNEQSLVVGPNYTGLAFKSDNAAFGGQSREVWFVFRGNLYQISTYARLDPLLKAMFKTWQFN